MRTSSSGGIARSSAWPELVHMPEKERRESAHYANPDSRNAADFSTPPPSERRPANTVMESELIESPFSVQRLNEDMNALVFSPQGTNQSVSPSKLERMETMFAALCNHNRVMEANFIELRNRLDVVQQHAILCVRTELRSVKAEHAALRELTDFFVSSTRHDLDTMAQALNKYVSATSGVGPSSVAAYSGGRVHRVNSLTVSDSTVASTNANHAPQSARNAHSKAKGERVGRLEDYIQGHSSRHERTTRGAHPSKNSDADIQHDSDLYAQYAVENKIPRDFQIALQHRSAGSDASALRSRTNENLGEGDISSGFEGGSDGNGTAKDGDAFVVSEEEEQDAVGSTPLAWSSSANHSSPFQTQRDLLLRVQEERKARRSRDSSSSNEPSHSLGTKDGGDDSTPPVSLLRYNSKGRKPTSSAECNDAPVPEQTSVQPSMPLSDTTLSMSFSSSSSSSVNEAHHQANENHAEGKEEVEEATSRHATASTTTFHPEKTTTTIPPAIVAPTPATNPTTREDEGRSDAPTEKEDTGAAYGDVVSLRGDVMQLRQGRARMEERLESQRVSYERQLSAAHEVHREREKTLQSQVDLLQRVVDANRARDADELTFLLGVKAGERLKGVSEEASRSPTAGQPQGNSSNIQDALVSQEQQHSEAQRRTSPHGSNVASLERAAKALLETTRDRRDASVMDATRSRSRGSSRPRQHSFGTRLADICDTANQLLARHPVRWSPSRDTSDPRESARPSRSNAPSTTLKRNGAKRSGSMHSGHAQLTKSGDILRPPTQSDMTRVAQGLWAEEELQRRQKQHRPLPPPSSSRGGKKSRQTIADSHFYCL